MQIVYLVSEPRKRIRKRGHETRMGRKAIKDALWGAWSLIVPGTVRANVEHTLMLSHPRARPVCTECPVPRGYRSAMDKILTQ